MSDHQLLPDFTAYVGKYLHGNIKREEIKLLKSVDQIYFFQVEYFTAVIPLEKDIDFSKSKSFIGGYSLLDDEPKVIYI